jgi:hypothetical protein
MVEQRLAEVLTLAAERIRGEGGELKWLDRGGIAVVEVALADAAGNRIAGGFELKGLEGYGLRCLRHGSHPGGRLELSFSGNKSTDLFAPGMCIKGGFTNVFAKRAAGSARIGKLSLAVLKERQVDLTEDLIISAIGPVDLLGTTDANGDPAAWVTVPEDTDPNAAFGTQVGAFDAAGWELLRVYLKATDITTADVHFFHNPSWVGTTWFHASIDGVFQMPDSPTSGHDFRTFMVPWGGRGVGCPAVYQLNPGALTGVDFIIQGVK